MIIDLHVHTSKTPDVSYTLHELLQRAKACGLDGMCITDVHTISGGIEAKKIAKEENMLVLAGFEAYTDRGHFLGFVPSPESLPEISSWFKCDQNGHVPFIPLMETIEQHQGVLIAAHPYDRSVQPSPGDGLIQLKGIAAIEVLNATRSSMVNEFAEEIATGIGLPGVGGSDSRKDLSVLGRYATLVLGDVSNESDLIERILSHDVWPVAIGEPAFDAYEYRSPGQDSGKKYRTHPGTRYGSNPKDRGRAGSKKPSKSAPSHSRFRNTGSKPGSNQKEKRFPSKHTSTKSNRTPPPKPKP